MLFNSLEFLIFFPIVISLYFLLPHSFRWILLLASSYVFYIFWNPIYILLIILSTLIDYVSGLQMHKHRNHTKKKKFYLSLSLLSNLGILFLFKYFNFFSETWAQLTNGDFNSLALILPMGISFYTFQTLSYSIDVYRGERDAERHLGYFALYVTFFPQLVAGPIERSTKLLPELKKINKYDYARFVVGLKRMTWGFFKKIVIADNISAVVNNIFNDIESMQGLTLVVGVVLFAYQIYCDFSGYSDIAIGSAKIMGIDLMENFKRPYLSKSIREFWSRWHISLSTWFRDYVYIPLGGSKVAKYRIYINILIVFTVSGLWHGAAWTFVVWGLIHGMYQVYERITLPFRNRLWKYAKLDGTKLQSFVQWLITITVVLISWVFFRAESISDALLFLRIIINSIIDLSILDNIYSNIIYRSSMGISRFIIIFSAIIILEFNNYLHEFKGFPLLDSFKKSIVLRWSVYYLILFFIIIFGAFGQAEFIYFQF